MFPCRPRGPAGSRRPYQGAVIDGAALGTLGLDGGGVLGELGCDDASAELQDLLIRQSWTLGDTKAPSEPPTTASTFTPRKALSGSQNSVFPFHLPVVLAPEALMRLF